MSDNLNFALFKESRQAMTNAELVEWTTNDEWNDLESALVYGDESWIGVRPDGQYWLTTGRDEWLDTDLDKMESRLFFFWYSSECPISTYDESDLVELLYDFAIAFGLEWQSADEMLHELAKIEPKDRTLDQANQVLFLLWFIDQWRDAELRAFEISQWRK